MTSKVTPVRQQYLDIKRQYPDAIVFFRLGDFYETFDQDAETTSRELDIVLTSRNIAKGVRVPMAGIPFHAAENYLSRLIEKGYHVAICEQVGDGPVKGLFPREVVRVVTPGTLVEPGLLPGDGNNYLLAVVSDEAHTGLAYVDITTGEFFATQFGGPAHRHESLQEINRLVPAEILHPENHPLEDSQGYHLTSIPVWKFEFGRAEEILKLHFGVASLDGFGLGKVPSATMAAGAIVGYLSETQGDVLPLLTQISTYSLKDFMVLDVATRRNLELVRTIRTGDMKGSLLGVIDLTVTPMGKRLIHQWISQPLLDLGRIQNRQDQVEAFFEDGIWRSETRQTLKTIGDMERMANRIVAGLATPRDLAALGEVLTQIPVLQELVGSHSQESFGVLRQNLDPCEEVGDLLERSIVSDPPGLLSQGGVIKQGFSKELDEILKESSEARKWISSLEATERERTGIKNLKVGFNKVFGYYLEISKSNVDRAPAEYIRKQTLVNAERYITPEMKEVEAKVLSAEERIRELESILFREICQTIGEFSPRLLRTARAVARLDVVSSLAAVAEEKGYVRPVLDESDLVEIQDGRHPVVEDFIIRGRKFVPNDTVFEEGERVRVITGPNMSGKSTYLRQVALIVLLAQMGSFVPAQAAHIGLVDRIFTRIGAQDEIHAGQSTFMVEMVEAANILHHATSRSLLVLDEIGRGTSTYDGLAIAWAVLEYIHHHPKLRSRTLFATHYHELTQLAEHLPGVRNYNVAVSEEGDQVVFLHRIIPGRSDKSYGIHVAEIAGLPRAVIHRAQELLLRLEADGPEDPRQTSAKAHQLALFSNEQGLEKALDAIDIHSLTPIDALNLLYEWKKEFLSED
jgi:DNA mismatch repair protein MutS